jgi:hypothetical protein
LGTNKIVSLAGAKTCNSVRQALIKFGIDVRSIGSGLTCNRESDGFVFNNLTKQVIEGGLLGDASLRTWQKGSLNANAFFCRRNKNYDHVLYVAKQIFSSEEDAKLRVNESIEKCSWDATKPYSVFSLRTLSHKELNQLYSEWYPKSNNYNKTIPLNFNITKQSLLHWFMDDGSSYQRRKESETKQVCITMCSESFNKEEQQRLVDNMHREFGLRARVGTYSDGTGWRIYFPQSQTNMFFSIVGDCPVPSMEYKWKIF